MTSWHLAGYERTRRPFAAFVGAVALALAIGGGAFSPASALACGNEALRQQQHSSQLPECRAWEMVSPAQKNGNSVSLTRGTTLAAPSGDAFAFASAGAFVDAPTSLNLSFYRAIREGSSWSTHSADVPQQNSGWLYAQDVAAFSADLSESFVVSRRALAPGAVEEEGNGYIRNDETGQNTLFATSPDEAGFINPYVYGSQTHTVVATPDFSHVAFAAAAPLTPGAPSANSNVYEFSAGHLELASILPDGTPAGEEALSIGLYPTGEGDRARLLFTAAREGTAGLYLREAGKTVAVSASHRVPQQPLGEGEVPLGAVVTPRFLGASADGSIVYFVSEIPLTNATGATDEDRVYRYDVASQTLTAITHNPNPGSAEAIVPIGVSQDGSYAYFSAKGVLAPGATQAASGVGTTNLYAWHQESEGHARTELIAQTECQTIEENGEPVEKCPEGGAPQEQSISPNGEHFAFASYSNLTRQEHVNPQRCPAPAGSLVPPGACTAVYRFDFAGEKLSCVSCGPTGTPPAGQSRLDGNADGQGPPLLSHDLGHNVLDSGTVYFDSPNDLTPEAVNGHEDVYQSLLDGELALLSSGTASGDAQFADASVGGGDVFFLTSTQLVAADGDSAYDVYDARAAGGLPSQGQTPISSVCRGQECQSPAGLPPLLPRPATTGVLRPAGSAVSFTVAALSRSQRDRLARTGRLTLMVAVSVPERVTVRATARVRGRLRTVAGSSVSPLAAGHLTIALSLSQVARAALARHQTLHVELAVYVSGAAAPKRLAFVVKRTASGR